MVSISYQLAVTLIGNFIAFYEEKEEKEKKTTQQYFQFPPAFVRFHVFVTQVSLSN